MLLYKKCLECGCEFDENDNYGIYKCTKCESEDYTEIYDLICEDCCYRFEGCEGEGCPECNSNNTIEKA